MIPDVLPDKNHIVGVVFKGYEFVGEEVLEVPNPNLGKWFKESNGAYYWGGGLIILKIEEEAEEINNESLEKFSITPLIKKKIEQVINAFETGSAQGRYDVLVKLQDYSNPHTGKNEFQVTYGRSQTTEFGHLKTLIADYIACNGLYADRLTSYISRLGKHPSLYQDDDFCDTLKKAGKSDPIMQQCQDRLFEDKYYQPAHTWFSYNGFTFPLSQLVVYDSFIHSGSVPSFLRKRFSTPVPVNGGNEKEWIKNYVQIRHDWLETHSKPILRKTTYRMQCFIDAISRDNWFLSEPINAHNVIIA